MAKNVSFSLFKNDVKRNPLVNAILFLFLFFSALLMATGVLVTERLSGSLDELMNIAQPPHFLQMHVGEINKESLDAFVASSDVIEAMQIQPMVQIDGVCIAFKRADGSVGSMGDSMIDNYFVMQNNAFDYLLDANRQIVSLNAGEVGVPVSYLEKYDLELGDLLIVRQEEGPAIPFVITDAILDAQMGSSLSSSLRFLVATEDFHTLSQQNAKHESIISFLLTSPSDALDFQERYSAAGKAVPQNGQSITIDLIMLVNTIGDGMMSVVLILLAAVLMVVALLNVRFTLFATLQDEVREIGMLQAVGLSKYDIKHLYMATYAFLSAVASVAGAVLAFPLAQLFTGHIAMNFGTSQLNGRTVAAPFIAALLFFVFVMVLLYVMLRRLSYLTILEALKDGNFTNAGKKKRRLSYKKPMVMRKAKYVSKKLALYEFRGNFRTWLLPIIIFSLMSFIILVPLNLYTTFASPDFIRYMGAAPCDVRIDIDRSSDVSASSTMLRQTLQQSDQVQSEHQVKTTEVQAETEIGRTSMCIETGKYDDFPIELRAGHLPNGDNELILSLLNAKRFNKEVGDPLVLFFDGKRVTFTITGIYQDITNGGLTAKTSRQDIGNHVVWETYYINLKEGANASVFSKNIIQTLPEIKAIPMNSYIDQTLGTITASLRTAVSAVIGVAALIAFLITTFFMILEIQRNYLRDATLRAIGFKLKDIRNIYLLQGGLAIFSGVVIGIVFSLIIGQRLTGAFFSLLGFGISNLKFSIDFLQAGLFGFVLPMVIGFLACFFALSRIEDVSLMNWSGV